MSFTSNLLKGKVGLVTGAGSPYGIGRSLVIGLAAAGARAVFATDLTLAHMESLQQQVKSTGSTCEIHPAMLDVTSEEQTKAVVQQALDTFGRFDFYFANAGISTHKPFADTDAAHYDKAIAILQRPVFLALKYGGHAMSAVSRDKTAPGGTIIGTSSIAGSTGGVADISYSTAKSAMSNMVMSGSVQLSATNVRVNSIAPGFIKSSIISSTQWVAGGGEKSFSKDEAAKQWASVFRAPETAHEYYYNRFAEPEEIANIGVFLASDLSASINGQNIVADSGKVVAALGESIMGPVAPLKPLQ